MKKYLNLYYLLSLICLAVYLVRADILHAPRVASGTLLLASLVFLFAGFLVDALAWYLFLRGSECPASYRDALVSSGLAIFGKYIPGKLWIVVGKAGYIAERTSLPVSSLSMLALKCQFLSLWVASVFASILFLWQDELLLYAVPMIGFFGLLSLLIFSDFFQGLFLRMVNSVMKKNITIPRVSGKDLLTVVPVYFANWLLWSLSFYFFLGGLGLAPLPFYVAFAFAFAAIVGIVALFSPGGLGVREGIIAFVLIGSGFAHDAATTGAVSSRLWFLTGELFIFILAAILKRRK